MFTSYLYFPITDKIQALKLLILVPRNRKSTQILYRSKVINIHFPKIKAGKSVKSVKQANKFELP